MSRSLSGQGARTEICPGICGLNLGPENGYLTGVLALFCLFLPGMPGGNFKLRHTRFLAYPLQFIIR